MATIPRAALDYLTKQINACSADAQAKALKLLEKIDWSDVAAARQAVIEAINILVAEYGLASAQAAADFYDASRELCTGEKLGAKAYTVHDPRATEGAIRAFVSRIVKNGDIDGFNKAVCSRIGYEIRRDANECIAENGAKDPLKPKFARVPGGGETCGFCLMLASFGYNYNSRQSASHAHDNCDCRIVCSWDEDVAEGYDPDGMYERYNKVLDSIGGRNGIRDEWDALPEDERDAYIARHGGKQGKAFDAFLNNRVSSEIERRDIGWFKTGMPSKPTFETVRFSGSQVGKKFGKHCHEWGLDPSSEKDRDKMMDTIKSIIDDADSVDMGEWRGRKGPCTFCLKGNDLVIIDAYGNFVTVMKGGGDNKRYRGAIGHDGVETQ